MQLTVATYNIHRCIGTDRRYDAPRVATVLDEMACDIVGLQEVENVGDACHDSLQLDYLAARLGMQAVPGLSILHHRGPYGNALLTRLPVTDVRRHDLSFDACERRGAIEVVLTVRGEPLRVFVTHLGLGFAERRAQGGKLLELLKSGPAMRCLVLGDMNEWIPGAQWLRHLQVQLGASAAPRSFPSFRPLLRLDRIWAGPAPLKIRKISAYTSPLARLASDHLPVRATLEGFSGSP